MNCAKILLADEHRGIRVSGPEAIHPDLLDQKTMCTFFPLMTATFE
jgi:hypothetical protein